MQVDAIKFWCLADTRIEELKNSSQAQKDI